MAPLSASFSKMSAGMRFRTTRCFLMLNVGFGKVGLVRQPVGAARLNPNQPTSRLREQDRIQSKETATGRAPGGP